MNWKFGNSQLKEFKQLQVILYFQLKEPHPIPIPTPASADPFGDASCREILLLFVEFNEGMNYLIIGELIHGELIHE